MDVGVAYLAGAAPEAAQLLPDAAFGAGRGVVVLGEQRLDPTNRSAELMDGTRLRLRLDRLHEADQLIGTGGEQVHRVGGCAPWASRLVRGRRTSSRSADIPLDHRLPSGAVYQGREETAAPREVGL